MNQDDRVMELNPGIMYTLVRQLSADQFLTIAAILAYRNIGTSYCGIWNKETKNLDGLYVKSLCTHWGLDPKIIGRGIKELEALNFIKISRTYPPRVPGRQYKTRNPLMVFDVSPMYYAPLPDGWDPLNHSIVLPRRLLYSQDGNLLAIAALKKRWPDIGANEIHRVLGIRKESLATKYKSLVMCQDTSEVNAWIAKFTKVTTFPTVYDPLYSKTLTINPVTNKFAKTAEIIHGDIDKILKDIEDDLTKENARAKASLEGA